VKLVTVLLFASCAVMVEMVKAVPAVFGEEIAEIAKWFSAPGITVIVPELVVVSDPDTAWIAALPTTCPVKVELVPVVGDRSPLTTPPVMLANDQVADTLATKLFEASREMAYTVNVLPEARL
jgi:hypothetical protein